MKKALSWILALCMIASFLCLPGLALEQDGKLCFRSLEIVDAASWTVRMTFSAPVRILNTGLVYLCNQVNPNDAGGAWGTGDWQVYLNRLTYENPTVKNGAEYSSSIVATFTEPTMSDAPEVLGAPAVVRICEYGVGDLNDGIVARQVVVGLDGSALSADLAAPGSDIAYAALDPAAVRTSGLSASPLPADELNWTRIECAMSKGNFTYTSGITGDNAVGKYPQPVMGFGEAIETTFRGSALRLYALRHPTVCCDAEIYIDGALAGVADGASASGAGTDEDVLVFSVEGLSDEEHSLKIVSVAHEGAAGTVFLPEYIEVGSRGAAETTVLFCEYGKGSFTYSAGITGNNTAGTIPQPVMNIGESIETTFRGAELVIKAVTHPTVCCDAEIYIDGVLAGRADGTQVNPGEDISFHFPVFSVSGLENKEHSLKIVSVAHDGGAGSIFLPETVEITSYSNGTWSLNPCGVGLGTFTHSSGITGNNAAGAYPQPDMRIGQWIETTFTGTVVELYVVRHATVCCDADVYLDGTLAGHVDGTVVTSGNGIDLEALAWRAEGLTNGKHTIKIVSVAHEGAPAEQNVFLPNYIRTFSEKAPCQVEVLFENGVTLPAENVKLVIGETTYPAIDAQPVALRSGGANRWLLSFDCTEDASGGKIVIDNLDAVVDVGGHPVLPNEEDRIELLLDPRTDHRLDPEVDLSALLTGSLQFMNADTGRVLGGQYLTVETDAANAKNRFALRGAEGYLSPNGFAAAPYWFILKEGTRSRYQILSADGAYALADSDQGGTNTATLKLTRAHSLIEAQWFITRAGEKEPLRLMPLGDSITYGVNQDVYLIDQAGCKPYLASMLFATEGFGDHVILVGSVRAQRAFESENTLYRGEGHPGWVAHNTLPYVSSMGQAGLDEYIDAWQQKYAPDIICMMIGTNDCGYMTSNLEGVQEFDPTFQGWKNLVDQILRNLDDDGLLIAATPTPHGDNLLLDKLYKKWGLYQNAYVAEKIDAGETRLAAADNYDYIVRYATRAAGTCSDNLHLSQFGYEKMAESYYKAILKKMMGIDLYEAGLTVEKVEMTGDKTLLLTFSRPVTLEGSPYVAIRIVDENNEMVWTGGAWGSGSPYQFDGSLAPVAGNPAQFTWTLTGGGPAGNVKTLHELLAYQGFEALKGYTSPKLCIEETDSAEGMWPFDGYVANLFAERADGGRDLLSADRVKIDCLDGTYTALTLPTYTVTLPQGEGFAASFEEGSAAQVDYLGSASFRIELDARHSESPLVVKANGEVIHPVNGVYTLENLTGSAAVTVEGVRVNKLEASAAPNQIDVGEEAPVTVTVNAPADLFEEASLNGSPLDPSAFTLEEKDGKTVFTLSAEAVAAAGEGKHKLTLSFATGEAEAEFELKAAGGDQPGGDQPGGDQPGGDQPPTGDLPLALLGLALAASLAGACLAIRARKAR